MGYLGKRKTVAALFLVFALLLVFFSVGLAKPLLVRVIDVGQGDSIFVRFPSGETMLVDAGTARAGGRVVETLRSLEVERIDILVATHPHADHIGGMLAVMDAFPIGKVWDSGYAHGTATQQRFLEAIRDGGIRFGRPKSGFSEEVGEVLIEVLAPVKEISGSSSDANNNSLVLRLSFGEISFLLTGDMEEEQRRSVGSFPETTILKVSHHGARNGTDAEFLEMLRPRLAVISCAAENPYGHPHSEVLDLLAEANAEVYTTIGGDVVVETDGKSFTVRKERRENEMEEDLYIGNRSSKVFHTQLCTSLPTERNRVILNSEDEALEAGYRPCRRCIE